MPLNILSKRMLFASVIILITFASCDISDISNKEPAENTSSTSTLSGTIMDISYECVSGYANSDSITYYTVYLLPYESAEGKKPWDAEAYSDPYPYLTFSINKNSTPGSYSVLTYAASGSKILQGRGSGSESILFSEGEIIISSIDTENYTISGSIEAKSSDGESDVSGTFEVPIQH
jgi:hypothetical protein